jgi:hypothetical protein
MNFIDFVQFVKTQCMHETIYEDSDGNLILVTRMLDAYAMANKMVAAEREACAKVCEAMPTYVGRNNAVTQSSAQDCAAAIRARGQA